MRISRSSTGPHFGRSADVVALDRVLVHRVAQAAADAQVLHRPGGTSTRPERGSSFGRKRSMIWAALTLALVERLERDVDDAGVRGAAAPVNAMTFSTPGSAWMIAAICRTAVHRLERRVLRPAGPPRDRARVLRREKALGDLRRR